MKQILLPSAIGSLIGAGAGAKATKDHRGAGALRGAGYGLIGGAGAGLAYKGGKGLLKDIKSEVYRKLNLAQLKHAPKRLAAPKLDKTIYSGKDGTGFSSEMSAVVARRKKALSKLKDIKTDLTRHQFRPESSPVSTKRTTPKLDEIVKQVKEKKPKAKKENIQGMDLADALAKFKSMKKEGSFTKIAILPAMLAGVAGTRLIGAGLGALTGAAVAPKGHRLSGAISGGAMGALTGGGSGLAMGAKALKSGRSLSTAGSMASRAFSRGATMSNTLKNVGINTGLTAGLNAMTGAYKPQNAGVPGYGGQFADPSMPMMKAAAGAPINDSIGDAEPSHPNAKMTAAIIGLAHAGKHIAKHYKKPGLAGLLAGASIVPAGYALRRKK